MSEHEIDWGDNSPKSPKPSWKAERLKEDLQRKAAKLEAERAEASRRRLRSILIMTPILVLFCMGAIITADYLGVLNLGLFPRLEPLIELQVAAKPALPPLPPMPALPQQPTSTRPVAKPPPTIEYIVDQEEVAKAQLHVDNANRDVVSLDSDQDERIAQINSDRAAMGMAAVDAKRLQQTQATGDTQINLWLHQQDLAIARHNEQVDINNAQVMLNHDFDVLNSIQERLSKALGRLQTAQTELATANKGHAVQSDEQDAKSESQPQQVNDEETPQQQYQDELSRALKAREDITLEKQRRELSAALREERIKNFQREQESLQKLQRDQETTQRNELKYKILFWTIIVLGSFFWTIPAGIAKERNHRNMMAIASLCLVTPIVGTGGTVWLHEDMPLVDAIQRTVIGVSELIAWMIAFTWSLYRSEKDAEAIQEKEHEARMRAEFKRSNEIEITPKLPASQPIEPQPQSKSPVVLEKAPPTAEEIALAKQIEEEDRRRFHGGNASNKPIG